MARTRHIACLLTAIAGCVALLGCQSGAGQAQKTSSPPTHTPTHYDVSGPEPPAQGSWLGAAVTPDEYTPPGRIRAYDEFEQDTGRQLDVVHTYHKWHDPFPDEVDAYFVYSGRQLLTGWAGSDCPGIAAGEYDDLIRQRAREVKAFGKPVMLAFRWEMDRPNLRGEVGSAADYVAAWKRTKRIFDEVGATNVGWVWAPTAEGFTKGYAQDFYPGDEHVDWIAVDAYTGMEVRPFGTVMAAFMRFARRHENKPVMIAEFGLSHRGGNRPGWLAAARTYVKDNPEIKAVLYFNGDMNDGPTRQFALDNSASGRRAFHSWLSDPYFNVRDHEVKQPR